jgi:hypothetical protein
LAIRNWNSVWPVGAVVPFWYFEMNPKFALPVSDGAAMYAPAGESIQPPPVTKPSDGS